MPQPNSQPAASDPDRSERERKNPEREPSSIADDRPRQRNRTADDDPLVDDPDVMPKNDVEDERPGRSDR